MYWSRLALITLVISMFFLFNSCKKKSDEEISSDEIMQSTDSLAKAEEISQTASNAPVPQSSAVSDNGKKGKGASFNDETVSNIDYKPDFSENGNLVVQLQVYSSRRMAERLATQLTDKGYPAYVAEVSNPTDALPGTFYRVRVGNFAGLAKARDFGDNVLAAMGYQYWVDNKTNDNLGKGGGSTSEPVYTSPAPSYSAPASEPTYTAPAPEPTYTAPAPAPEPTYTAPAPAPEPTYTAPAPAPVPAPAPAPAPAGGEQNFDF